jgi:general secretion pathway protein L
MERELAVLRQGTGTAASGDLEPMLAAVAAAAPGAQALSDIQFSSGELRLLGSETGGEQLASLLQGRGYSARTDGDRVIVRRETAP